jgi:DNA-binding NtrC family response regulator
MDTREKMLEGKRILVVDDEPDVLETLEDILSMCEVVKASSFEEGKKELESGSFDFAILDIMGVNGYALLDIAAEKKITAVMLTAHALSPADTVKSFRGGAASYVPKDKINDIPDILVDILEARKKGAGLVVAVAGENGNLLSKEIRPGLERQGQRFLGSIYVLRMSLANSQLPKKNRRHSQNSMHLRGV